MIGCLNKTVLPKIKWGDSLEKLANIQSKMTVASDPYHIPKKSFNFKNIYTLTEGHSNEGHCVKISMP